MKKLLLIGFIILIIPSFAFSDCLSEDGILYGPKYSVGSSYFCEIDINSNNIVNGKIKYDVQIPICTFGDHKDYTRWDLSVLETNDMDRQFKIKRNCNLSKEYVCNTIEQKNFRRNFPNSERIYNLICTISDEWKAKEWKRKAVKALKTYKLKKEPNSKSQNSNIVVSTGDVLELINNVKPGWAKVKVARGEGYILTNFIKPFPIRKVLKEEVQVAQNTNQKTTKKETKDSNNQLTHWKGAYTKKFIELHNKAIDEGKKTIVYDDGNTYVVGNKKIRTTNTKKVEQTKVVASNLDKKSLKEELKYWKELFDDELISKEEYDAKRKALLEGGVVTTSQVEETKKTEVVKISKPKGDSSFKNKNYVSKKTNKDWLWEIIEFCDKNYSKAMESIECSRDNLEATKYYKKGKSSKMDLYKLYLMFTDQVTKKVIDGNIGVSEAKLEMAMFQSQMVSQIKNRISQEDAERESRKRAWKKIGDLGREMMKPGFDWTTGTSSPTQKSNVWTQGPGFLVDEYTSGFNKICIYDHVGSEVAKTIGNTELCPLTH